MRREHGQRQHQDDAVAVGRAVAVDDRDEVEQRKRQRERDPLGQQAVEREPEPSVDLQQRPQRQDAEHERAPCPGRDPPPARPCAGERQRQRRPPQEHRVDVAEAALALLHRTQRGLPFPLRAEQRVERGRRDQPHEIRAELDALAPALQRVIAAGKLARDRQQRGQPE